MGGLCPHLIYITTDYTINKNEMHAEVKKLKYAAISEHIV